MLHAVRRYCSTQQVRTNVFLIGDSVLDNSFWFQKTKHYVGIHNTGQHLQRILPLRHIDTALGTRIPGPKETDQYIRVQPQPTFILYIIYIYTQRTHTQHSFVLIFKEKK